MKRLLLVALSFTMPFILGAQAFLYPELKTLPPGENYSRYHDFGPNHWVRNFSSELFPYSANEKDAIVNDNAHLRAYNEKLSDGARKKVPDGMSNFHSYPNPFSNELILVFDLYAGGDVHFALIDMQGKTVLTESFYAAPGRNTFTLRNLDGLKADTYFLLSDANGEQKRYKLIKRN